MLLTHKYKQTVPKVLININKFCSGQIGCYANEEENKLSDGCSSSNHSGATFRKSDEKKYYLKNKEVILNN